MLRRARGSVGRSGLAAGVAPVPQCGFVTTPSDPATEPRDGVLLVCQSSRLRRCWHPVAFSSQVGTAPAARTLLGTHVGVVAHAGRTAPFGCGSMPASLGSALQGHRHQRPARVPVPRLAVRARRRRGRDPATGDGGVAAPVGVPAGAAHGRGVRHGLDLPGAAAASSDPDHPRVRRLPLRTHRDRSDPLPRQRRRNHRQQHRLHPRRIRPLGLFRRGSRPACAGRVGATFLISASRSATGRCRSPALPPWTATRQQAVGDRDVAALRAGGAHALLRRQHPHPGQRVLPGAGRRHRRPPDGAAQRPRRLDRPAIPSSTSRWP